MVPKNYYFLSQYLLITVQKWRQIKNPTQHNIKAIETLPQKKEVCSKIAANFTTLYSDTEKTIHLKRGKSK